MSTSLIVIFAFGVIFVITIIVLAVKIENPSTFQEYVFRTVLAISCAGVAAVIPGFFEIQSKLGDTVLRAGGALAVLVLIYRINPAKLLSQQNKVVESDPQKVVESDPPDFVTRMLNTAIEMNKYQVELKNSNHKEKISEYLLSISDCIKELITIVQNRDSNGYWQGTMRENCAQIEIYTRHLKDLLTDLVSKDEIEELDNSLQRVIFGPRFFSMTHDLKNHPGTLRSTIRDLNEAAGLFKGIALTLKAKSG